MLIFQNQHSLPDWRPVEREKVSDLQNPTPYPRHKKGHEPERLIPPGTYPDFFRQTIYQAVFATSCKNSRSDDRAKFQTLIRGLVGPTIQYENSSEIC